MLLEDVEAERVLLIPLPLTETGRALELPQAQAVAPGVANYKLEGSYEDDHCVEVVQNRQHTCARRRHCNCRPYIAGIAQWACASSTRHPAPCALD